MTALCSAFTALHRRLRVLAWDFRHETKGIAAVEFALVLPILVVLYLGSIELTNGLTVNRKVAQVASTVGDLIAQYRTLDCPTVDDIFQASSAIMTPYNSTGLSLSVAGIRYDSAGVGTVDWSRTNAGGTADGLLTEVPLSLQVADTYLVIAKSDFTYQALFTSFSNDQFGTTSWPLSDIFFLRPRVGSEINFSC
ncbi:MAG: TadE/TadG family type IV pilus assembly protein [Pseudomonadota bacterium]